jgi:hypothetical protein
MWRIVLYLLYINKASFSIPIESYIAINSRTEEILLDIRSVSDASPYRICSAIYSDDCKGTLLGWTSVALPYQKDIEGKYQCSREYLGLFLSLLLVARVFPDRARSATLPPIGVRWVNDNTGALAWADKFKSSSLASIVATTAVTSIQLLTNISFARSEWIPGLTMGDIDHESRREEHQIIGDYSAPSLLPELFFDLESIAPIMQIIKDCEPARTIQYSVSDYHSIFLNIQQQLSSIMD